MADRIYIRDLSVRCIVGTNPDERRSKQEVIINIVLDCDLAPAAESDSIDDTVNYRTLKKEIMQHVEASAHLLIERMAARIADLCLRHDRVRGVKVTVDKPGALRWARSVAVEIERRRA